MSKKNFRPTIEALEARIAPAAVAALPTIKDAELAWDKGDHSHFVTAVTNTPILLKAGQVLTTGAGARSGTYLMFVEKGTAKIFTTDLNNNGQVDYNEITGIAAGDGLRLISFVDIHGDIVTNLDTDLTLSDSDNNAANNPLTGGDGRVLNNARIDSITMRSLTPADITDQNGGMIPDVEDVKLRLAFTSYSIFGEILAGKGLGVDGDPTSGLHIDASGVAIQKVQFGDNGIGANYFVTIKPTIGAIRTGTAVNGEYFSFGYSRNVDVQGDIATFSPLSGQAGGDVVNVTSNVPYNLSGVYAGDGGLGARGGNISNVTVNGDDTSGYNIVAGNGGRGTTGGAGGAIINFTDVGSQTGQVLIQTGDGGQGTNGVGGNGGTLGLGSVIVSPSKGVSEAANINVNAGLTINLGDGGTGFRGGGNGASLTNLILRTPDTQTTIGLDMVGTTHDHAHDPTTGLLTGNAVIGNANFFDFDGDGVNDVVYSSTQPNQLWVAFGDAVNGGFSTAIQLDGPSNIQAIAVADINGDGHPDIIVGSAQAGDFSGLTVFLSKYSNNNGVAQFEGFSSPRMSPLPSLESGDPGSPFDQSVFTYRRSSNPITSIAAGDFDGDGHTDIAVTAAYVTTGLIGGSGPNAATIEQVLIYMTPDVENGVSTGHFYADFGTKAGNGQLSNASLPFVSLGTSPNAKILATALNPNSPYDMVASLVTDGTLTLGTVTGIPTVAVMPPPNSYLRLWDFHDKTSAPVETAKLKFAMVDTNRAAAAVTLVQATLRDFAIIDFNQDHFADFIALTDTPTSILIGIKGDGVKDGSPALVNPGTSDNAGYQFLAPIGTVTGIRGALPTDQGSMSGVIVLDNTGFETVSFLPPPAPGGFLINPGVNLIKSSQFFGPTDPKSYNAFDSYYAQFDPTVPVIDPMTPKKFNPDRNDDIAFIQTAFANRNAGLADDNFGRSFEISQHYEVINAGDGGEGQIGKGGLGGSIGSGMLTDAGTRIQGSIDYTLPATGAQEAILTGGKGGNGFSSGGAGGSVTGVVVRFNPDATIVNGDVELIGGAGGTGNSGAGGAGGALAKNSVVFGSFFGGLGGNGITGGNGGSIIGNGFKQYSDDISTDQFLIAGDAGNGVTKGGIGGSVSGFHGEFSLNFVGGFVGGTLSYAAGKGGSATAGPGGAGGDVINDSPFTGGGSGRNLLAGNIALLAGAGGDGTIGGRGGNVSGFVNQQSSDNPGLLAFIAGSGGDGSKGNGGAGGSVSNISASSTGTARTNTTPASEFTYNHVVAGAGGDSASATGGAGGSVTSINTTASDGIYAIAAGAGGDGLLVGGAGGAVKTVALAVGGTTGKGLVVAGSGGSAGAFAGDGTAASPGIGGKIGKGGAGGGILNFTQSGATAAHFDLIAGNGGDSLNFGSLSNTTGTKYVGTGGSVSGVTVQGTLGNIDPTLPIKSYNNVATGESMADFVDAVLRQPTDPSFIDDSHGNVGVVVGGSGRLNSLFVGYDANHNAIFRSIAAFGAINGDLLNIRSGGIMSAVAGNVELIAAIRTVKNLTNINPGPLRIGYDKTPLVGPDVLEYRSGDPDGKIADPLFPNDPTKRIFPSAPVLDGKLVDGALVSATLPVGSVFAPGSHVFVTTH